MKNKRRALISVSDKQGIVEFARKLTTHGWEILSTGGTAAKLDENGIPVTPVSQVTDFPEILGGRVKTLNPRIHGGILADRDKPGHLEELETHAITPIDLVVVNLYPFRQTLDRLDATREMIIENIDIGGPTMIRAAAKNFRHCSVLVDPADYPGYLEMLKKDGPDLNERMRLAAIAFRHTAHYDQAIAQWFGLQTGNQEYLQRSEPLREQLRYGENPHQRGAFFADSSRDPFRQLHGQQLSYNNYQDVDAALRVIQRFKSPACAILKHTNPCGIGLGNDLTEAYQNAFACDTESPFGGIVIVNRKLEMETVQAINQIFTEIVIAPDFSAEALNKLRRKKNRRLLQFDPSLTAMLGDNKKIVSCLNGLLMQDEDIDTDRPAEWKVVTKRKPDPREQEALAFAWHSVASLKSNAVCFTTDRQTLGLGIGQTSRIGSTRIAVANAKRFGHDLKGAVCASDGFFPFRDSVDEIAALGIRAIIQPGGSRGDEEVIKACDEHNISMIMTGMRHFRH